MFTHWGFLSAASTLRVDYNLLPASTLSVSVIDALRGGQRMQEGANETSHLGRALALALCTLWGNILFLDGSGSVLLSAPFASRMASMAFSVVGFAAAWLVARSCGVALMRSRVALLGVCARLSCIFLVQLGYPSGLTGCQRRCSRLPSHSCWWHAVRFTLR